MSRLTPRETVGSRRIRVRQLPIGHLTRTFLKNRPERKSQHWHNRSHAEISSPPSGGSSGSKTGAVILTSSWFLKTEELSVPYAGYVLAQIVCAAQGIFYKVDRPTLSKALSFRRSFGSNVRGPNDLSENIKWHKKY